MKCLEHYVYDKKDLVPLSFSIIEFCYSKTHYYEYLHRSKVKSCPQKPT